MILLFGTAMIALLCMGLLLISSERREGSRVASDGITGWEDLAIPLLGIATMALLCTAGLRSAPRRPTAPPPPPTANRAPAALAPTATSPAITPPAAATPSPSTTPPPPTSTTTLAAVGLTPSATGATVVRTVVAIASAGAVPASTAVLGPQAQATVDRARTRFDQVRALHFVLRTEGEVYLDLSRTQKLTAAEGDLLRPDRVSLTAKLSADLVDTELRLIQIGDGAYLTNMRTGGWEKAPAGLSFDAGFLFDQDRGVSALLGKGLGWQRVETVTVNGVETQHVRGAVPAASVNDLVGSSLRGEYVDVDLSIESSNADIVRFIVSERPSVATANAPASRWTLDLARQNELITIDAPTLGSQR